ncbi:ABC transporter ATP-binding protein [Magnetospira sp. QH-2]|uniref:ABC transporter ATP-binding protein n=1 Tax=Magnetospira sp. (strain QH-2) TaxID=1288970 RepID=UPI0003E8151A|nr:ABC transporter ATP-binding protein [Magnetospira sp. QH-2]CCQ73668.1 D-ala-D-ala transporter subunit; ATP-binding component of ABC superfamily [Magnetospira sp. QH-2]
MIEPLLRVENLEVEFPMRNGTIAALRGIHLSMDPGEIVGLVGESGSGKSVFAKALMRILPPPGRVSGGTILFRNQDISEMDGESLRALRGDRIAMIFQDPMATLNPVIRIDEQMIEAIQAHDRVPRGEARARCLDALKQVGIPSPEERLRSYPHQLSGGMRQRIAIATALLNKPDLILADEATTALDVTIQAQILYEVRKLCEESGTALIWVTHDLAVVSGIADRIAVMYAGQIVEYGATSEIVTDPRHPYTRGLIDSVPTESGHGQPLAQIPGLMPSPGNLPPGCAFAPRCSHADALCQRQAPYRSTDGDRQIRCHHPLGKGAAQ